MHQAQLILQFSSMKSNIKIVITKLVILKHPRESPTIDYEIKKYLLNFCSWQLKKRPPNDAKDHWDYAIMLTGYYI